MASRTQRKRAGTQTAARSPPSKKPKGEHLIYVTLCASSSVENLWEAAEKKDRGGKPRARKGKGAKGHRAAPASSDGEAELSDGLEVAGEPSKKTAKASRKVTVQEVEDEGEGAHLHGGGENQAAPSESSSEEDEQEQLGA